MINPSVVSSTGVGCECPIVLDDINYVTSTSEYWASGELTFDTTKLIYKEDLLKTHFNGMSGDKVLGYDIDIEKLFTLTDGTLLEYNIIFIDLITKQTYNGTSVEVPVMTALEIDVEQSTIQDRAVLKSTSTVARTNFGHLVRKDNDSLYDNVMQSSFVNDSSVNRSTLNGFIFMWASTKALKESYRYLFDSDVDFWTVGSLLGVFDDSTNYKFALSATGYNDRSYKDIVLSFLGTASAQNIPVVDGDVLDSNTSPSAYNNVYIIPTNNTLSAVIGNMDIHNDKLAFVDVDPGSIVATYTNGYESPIIVKTNDNSVRITLTGLSKWEEDVVVADVSMILGTEVKSKIEASSTLLVDNVGNLGSQSWFLSFSDNFKRLEPTSTIARDIDRVVNDIDGIGNTFDKLRSYTGRDMLFCYMFSASNTLLASHPTEDSQEEMNLLNKQQQTLSLYSGIDVLQSITEIRPTIELVLNVATLANPFAVVDIEVSITEGNLTNNYITSSDVVPMDGSQELKAKFFNKFEVERNEYGNISTVTIEPNNDEYISGAYPKPRYMIINWLYR